jgi:hypothetical protein
LIEVGIAADYSYGQKMRQLSEVGVISNGG